MHARHFDEVMGTRRSIARISDMIDKVRPNTSSTALVPASPSMVGFFRDINASRPADVPDHIGTLVGAAVGGFALRTQHPVLGIIGGASLGRNVPALFQADVRGLAVRNLVTTGAAVAGSFYWPKHPIIGFLAGWLLGGTAAYVSGLK